MSDAMPHIESTQDLVDWVHSSDSYSLEDYSQARSLEESATMEVSWEEGSDLPGWSALKLAQVANAAGWHVEIFGAEQATLTQALC